MDLSKAFDCISHKLLVAQFRSYGLSMSACHLFTYENGRSLLGTKFLGNCMCYHGMVIIEGCRTKCVIDKYTNIFIF